MQRLVPLTSQHFNKYIAPTLPVTKTYHTQIISRTEIVVNITKLIVYCLKHGCIIKASKTSHVNFHPRMFLVLRSVSRWAAFLNYKTQTWLKCRRTRSHCFCIFPLTYEKIKISLHARRCETINFCNQVVHHLFSGERLGPLNFPCPFITCYCLIKHEKGEGFFIIIIIFFLNLHTAALDSRLLAARLPEGPKGSPVQLLMEIFSLLATNKETLYRRQGDKDHQRTMKRCIILIYCLKLWFNVFFHLKKKSWVFWGFFAVWELSFDFKPFAVK